MKRTNYIPPIVTLFGCLAACVISIINRYEALDTMIIVLVALVIFYIAGLIIKVLADKNLVIAALEITEEESSEEDEESEEDADSADEQKAEKKDEKSSEKEEKSK